MQKYAEELARDSIILVPLYSSDILPDVVSGWEHFRGLPDEEKDRWAIDLPIDDPSQRPDTGFRRSAQKGEYLDPAKRKPGDGKDPKCRFH